jgi:hypothetical protein
MKGNKSRQGRLKISTNSLVGKWIAHRGKPPDGTTESLSKVNIFAETAEAVIVVLVILLHHNELWCSFKQHFGGLFRVRWSRIQFEEPERRLQCSETLHAIFSIGVKTPKLILYG